jgi:Rho termination factor, N-terminal domain
MSHFASSPEIASLDDFLTILMVVITVVFSFYLSVMFTIGAIDRYPLYPAPSHSSSSSQSPPPRSSRYSQGVVFQDTIQPFKRPLTHLTIRQLKQRAKEAHIPRYSRMIKSQLVTALQAI